MCGIYFSCGESELEDPKGELRSCLEKRGPDYCHLIKRNDPRNMPSLLRRTSEEPPYFLNFFSTVLSLRGDQIVKQPLVDSTSTSVLCWNGEGWTIDDKPIRGNDAEAVFNLLLRATTPDEQERGSSAVRFCGQTASDRVVEVFSRIKGPYAFVYYDARNARVFYGRDVLGRRSLLLNRSRAKSLAISSVCDPEKANEWEEVEADGVYVIDLSEEGKIFSHSAETRAHTQESRALVLEQSVLDKYSISLSKTSLVPQFPLFNKSTPITQPPSLRPSSTTFSDLASQLEASLRFRAERIPVPPCEQSHPPRLAILFSGGLDCTLLACLVHDFIPKDQEIDLLNVAFENPRVIKAATKHGQMSPSPYTVCPDRVTGLSSYAELKKILPERSWRFVSIDVPYEETIEHRPQIISLIQPHNTEMDLSIACALYFAARGRGFTQDTRSQARQSYTTPARVLLSGLGADELFGGYTRHAMAFERAGYIGLIDELELDFNRLGKRNLGRDDRVISHWGREVRYPYLDECLVSWALGLPVWEKCGFRKNQGPVPEPAEFLDRHRTQDISSGIDGLESGKQLLRLLALKKGLPGAASERKRAIQFGARTAKMEVGKVKGTQALSREKAIVTSVH